MIAKTSTKAASAEAKNSTARESWETIKTLFWALLIAMIFRSFAYEPFHIPSGSMKENLLVGDYLFVSKYSYGYSRYSFPFGLVPIEGRTGENRPERGDVVVFRLPTMPSIDYIKRVIGLPGDRIQVRGGVVYLNGEALKREKTGVFKDDEDPDRVLMIDQYTETLPGGRSYTVLDATPEGKLDNTGEYTVPAGHYFMMGDNRDNSQDSRVMSLVGFVPEANLVGKAEIIFFSTNGQARFWELWKWPGTLRTERFLKDIP